MKKVYKFLSLFIVLLFLTNLVFPLKVNSADYYFGFKSNSEVFYDALGKEFKAPVKTEIKEGVFLVPLRAVVEDAGGVVRYYPETRSIELSYGKNKGYVLLKTGVSSVNGKNFAFHIKPFVVRGHTLIDVRFISLLFGGKTVFSENECRIIFYRVVDIKDALENKVYLYKEPKRIVSLAPNLTEILFGIGARNKIVGVSNYSDYPEDAKKLPKVGGFFNPSIERIFALNPDLVLVARGTPLSVIDKLRSLGISVFASDPKTTHDIYNLILTVGELTGNVKESVSLVNKMKSEESAVLKKTEKIPMSKRLKVYVEIWNNPKMSAGKDTFIDSLIKEAGGINIAENAKGSWPVMSDESIIKANPDVIILLYRGDIKQIESRPGWKTINAVKNHRIYIEDPDIFERPGPRIIQALVKLYGILYGNNG